MKTYTTIELQKPAMQFSAGHFTIFSPTRRERLHGHNFRVNAAFDTAIDPELGMAFDYGIYHQKLRDMCGQIDQAFLLPTRSPYLTIEEKGSHIYAHFNGEIIPFLKKDVELVPLKNITLEEISAWFVSQLTEDKIELDQHAIYGITVKIFSAPGQSGSCRWERQQPE